MNKVTPEAVKTLLQSDDNITISLYFPTHPAPTSVHVQEDKIRFKNMIRAGKEALEAKGVDDDTIRKLTNQLENNLYDDEDFWQHTTEGLAIFSSLSGIQYCHLPMECDERASAGDSYDTLPLLIILSYDQPYYLLALAAHQPILYQGDMYGVEPVGIALPESPEAALGIDELYSNSRTVRAGGGYGPGNPSSGSHGQGDSRQAGQEERLEFFRIIDSAIVSSDQTDNALPLLIAGSEGDISDYKELSQRSHILGSYLAGNYTRTSGMKPPEIHARSWHAVQEEVGRQKRADEVERFNELRGAWRSSTELEDIKNAATEGRVDALLIGMLTITRDIISDGDEAVIKLIFPDDYEKNNTEALGRTVFNQGGKIIGLLREDMPAGASVAAMYRY